MQLTRRSLFKSLAAVALAMKIGLPKLEVKQEPISSVAITNAGSGYSQSPMVTISGGGWEYETIQDANGADVAWICRNQVGWTDFSATGD
jgi:hypothetical protein